MIELAAFLGNPGRKYSHSRHNTGYMLAEKLFPSNSLDWQKKFGASLGIVEKNRLPYLFHKTPPEFFTGEGRLYFAVPETYMNLSGEPVSGIASFYKIKAESVIVIHDELELPLGTLSLKSGGGLGGHNGLRSLKACFGTADFWRIRIGIGRPDSRLPGEGGPPGSGEGIVDWVLSNFSAEEKEILDTVLNAGAELLFDALVGDPKDLLKEWAKKKIETP